MLPAIPHTPHISKQKAGDGAYSDLQTLIQVAGNFQYVCFVVRHQLLQGSDE